MKNLRLWWTGSEWKLLVPTTLSSGQIGAIVAWALPKQIQRLRGMSAGERKEDLQNAIAKLQRGEITQVLFDHDGDGVVIPFNCNERSRPERTTVLVP